MIAVLIFIVIFPVVGLYYYRKSVNTPIRVYFVATKENLTTLSKCPTLFSRKKDGNAAYHVESDGGLVSDAKYRPPFWLLNVHLHTIWAAKVRLMLNLPYKRELLMCEDGGTISLDWFDPINGTPAAPNTPTILILHGLTGGSFETYVQHLAYHAMKTADMRIVVMNFRGCANTKVTSARIYCAANTDDCRFVVEYVRGKIPDAPLFAAGFSLGSVILVKYLSQVGENSPFIAAASLSNPMDLHAASLDMERSWIATHLYGRALSSNIKRMMSQWQEFWEGLTDVDLVHVMQSRTLLEFDERFTAKRWGYKNAEEYYRDASPVTHLHKVRTRLLCVNCIDDPLTHVEGIIPQFKKNPNVFLVVTKWGGHLGFLEGWGRSEPSFSDRAVVEFFLSHLTNIES